MVEKLTLEVAKKQISKTLEGLDLSADRFVLMQNKYNNLPSHSGGILKLVREKFMQRELAKAENSFMKAAESFEEAVRKKSLLEETKNLMISQSCYLDSEKRYLLTNIWGARNKEGENRNPIRVHRLCIWDRNSRSSIAYQTVGFLGGEPLSQKESVDFFEKYNGILFERDYDGIGEHCILDGLHIEDYFERFLRFPNLAQRRREYPNSS